MGVRIGVSFGPAVTASEFAAAVELIAAYTAAGLSKFVIRPATATVPLEEFIAGFAAELMPLEG